MQNGEELQDIVKRAYLKTPEGNEALARLIRLAVSGGDFLSRRARQILASEFSILIISTAATTLEAGCVAS